MSTNQVREMLLKKKKNIGMKNVFLSTSDSIIYLHKDEATRDAGQEKLP